MIPTSAVIRVSPPSNGNGPIDQSGAALIEASERLGDSGLAAIAKAAVVPFLFEAMEQVFASSADPARGMNEALERATIFLDATPQIGAASVVEAAPASLVSSESNTATTTGIHYSALFGAFSPVSFWEEPVHLLRTRLERNGLVLPLQPRASVLDAGCGGGRYSAAWRLLGAATVRGIDISPVNVSDAQERIRASGIEGVDFDVGSVLDLPYESGTFDVVFSNGVLHHTTDWRTGVSELVRVLKPAGCGWLYLIERPGGLFWDVMEILRCVMQPVERDAARQTLRALGVPANRVFYMLDHVMVPINLRLTSEEIESALTESGATHVRRLVRGADFDRVERIFRGEPHARAKFGVGEHRYVFTRD